MRKLVGEGKEQARGSPRARAAMVALQCRLNLRLQSTAAFWQRVEPMANSQTVPFRPIINHVLKPQAKASTRNLLRAKEKGVSAQAFAPKVKTQIGIGHTQQSNGESSFPSLQPFALVVFAAPPCAGIRMVNRTNGWADAVEEERLFAAVHHVRTVERVGPHG